MTFTSRSLRNSLDVTDAAYFTHGYDVINNTYVNILVLIIHKHLACHFKLRYMCVILICTKVMVDIT
jgi:hypothetical protein